MNFIDHAQILKYSIAETDCNCGTRSPGRFFPLSHYRCNMSSVLQKLITPLASSPAEPPRNKVTVVGVGQVGMACAISILLRVRYKKQQWVAVTQ